jgi:chromate transporter
MPLEARVPTHGIRFWEAFRVWLRVALQSFGGPAGQIAVMHRILVDEKRWMSEDRFLHALNYCMLLPGPEAQQLATYMGWLLHRIRGGLAAGILFVLPGFAAILLLSILYAGFQDLRIVQALFFGLKPAVLAIVVEAVLRIGGRALKKAAMVSIAVLAFIAIFVFNVPFPFIVLTAAVVGYAGGRLWLGTFALSPFVLVERIHEMDYTRTRQGRPGGLSLADQQVCGPTGRICLCPCRPGVE